MDTDTDSPLVPVYKYPILPNKVYDKCELYIVPGELPHHHGGSIAMVVLLEPVVLPGESEPSWTSCDRVRTMPAGLTDTMISRGPSHWLKRSIIIEAIQHELSLPPPQQHVYFNAHKHKDALQQRLQDMQLHELQRIRRQLAASTIQARWRDVASRPNHPVCQRRLMQEFCTLTSDGTTSMHHTWHCIARDLAITASNLARAEALMADRNSDSDEVQYCDAAEQVNRYIEPHQC